MISESVKLKLAYIGITRYIALSAPDRPGAPHTPHDAIAVYGPLFQGSSTAFFVNGGFSPPEAATLIQEGKINGVFFGSLWISNPDLARRIQYEKALETRLDYGTFYGHGGTEEEERKGYTDYPVAVY